MRIHSPGRRGAGSSPDGIPQDVMNPALNFQLSYARVNEREPRVAILKLLQGLKMGAVKK